MFFFSTFKLSKSRNTSPEWHIFMSICFSNKFIYYLKITNVFEEIKLGLLYMGENKYVLSTLGTFLDF